MWVLPAACMAGECGGVAMGVLRTVPAWISAVGTLLIGVVGLVLAQGIRRDLRLKVAERRLSAYEWLWSLLAVSSPNAPPLSADDRERLWTLMTAWYYENGDGLLLDRGAHAVYLTAKANLVCTAADLVPRLSAVAVQECDGHGHEQAARDRLSRRQLSLLRTQLKGDVAICGVPSGPPLSPTDIGFLEACGVNVQQPPWQLSTKVGASLRRHLGRDRRRTILALAGDQPVFAICPDAPPAPPVAAG
jgi:hypothetical protein